MALSVEAVVGYVFTFAVGGVGGAITAIISRRVKDAEWEARMARAEASHDKLEEQMEKRLDTIDRRQIASLQMTAHIARKVGVTERFDDAIVRFLTADSEG